MIEVSSQFLNFIFSCKWGCANPFSFCIGANFSTLFAQVTRRAYASRFCHRNIRDLNQRGSSGICSGEVFGILRIERHKHNKTCSSNCQVSKSSDEAPKLSFLLTVVDYFRDYVAIFLRLLLLKYSLCKGSALPSELVRSTIHTHNQNGKDVASSSHVIRHRQTTELAALSTFQHNDNIRSYETR